MNKKYSSNFAFLDLLFNALLCFATFFVISLIFMRPVARNKDIDTDAIFMISISWPSEDNDDIDLYVEDPDGNVVFFKNKESDIMFLNRDDVGHNGERVINEFGEQEYLDNSEMITIRGIKKGEYVVNIHAYRKFGDEPTDVGVNIEKISPYSIIYNDNVILNSSGEERTVCRFDVDINGNVVGRWNAYKSLAYEKLEEHGYGL